MIKYKTDIIYYRLIALWVVCEAMLGGIIHGLKLPISGLVVGSCAVVCISLIGWYVPGKYSIIKATLIVAIFKMMLSPQAPFPAYIAVFFQGLLGQVLFFNRTYFKPASIVFAVLALLESGLQRILVLTIIYGNDLWTVINDFINGLTKQKNNTNYSLWIAGGYTAIHFIAGLMVGAWVSRIPQRIQQWKQTAPDFDTREKPIQSTGTKKKKFRAIWLLVWLFLVALYVQSYYRVGEPLLPASLPLKLLIRSLIIILAWVLIVGPVLKMLLHQWLQRKKTGLQNEISAILELIPSVQNDVIHAWKNSSGKKGFSKLALFGKISLVNTVAEEINNVFILTAPIGSGKTTSLQEWSEGRKDVHGILTPVIDGKRVFQDVESREIFNMEAAAGETNVLTVGRFTFNKDHFQKAGDIIGQGIHKPGWLVIDEIGPLELKGEGFHDILKEVINNRKRNLIIVIRSGLVDDVANYFQIRDDIIISSVTEIPLVQSPDFSR